MARYARSAVRWLLFAISLSSLAARAEAASYPEGERHSPMTREVVERQKAVVADGAAKGARPDVFAKIGDSITVHRGFFQCFSDAADLDWGDHGELEDTRAFFSRTRADDEHDSFSRKSRAAGIGWSTFGALGGTTHSPLRAELLRVRPALAVVMLGTNETYGGGVPNYRKNLRRLIAAVLDESVLPVLSTIPPRRDSRDLDALVIQMNAVVRELAEEERLPLVDYGAELRRLPGFGLGPDGIHPAVAGKRPCALDEPHLSGGVNVRNLVTLEALDRVRRFVLGDAPPEPG